MTLEIVLAELECEAAEDPPLSETFDLDRDETHEVSLFPEDEVTQRYQRPATRSNNA